MLPRQCRQQFYDFEFQLLSQLKGGQFPLFRRKLNFENDSVSLQHLNFLTPGIKVQVLHFEYFGVPKAKVAQPS